MISSTHSPKSSERLPSGMAGNDGDESCSTGLSRVLMIGLAAHVDASYYSMSIGLHQKILMSWLLICLQGQATFNSA